MSFNRILTYCHPFGSRLMSSTPSGTPAPKWTLKEDLQLISLVASDKATNNINWSKLKSSFKNTRSLSDIEVRWKTLKNGTPFCLNHDAKYYLSNNNHSTNPALPISIAASMEQTVPRRTLSSSTHPRSTVVNEISTFTHIMRSQGRSNSGFLARQPHLSWRNSSANTPSFSLIWATIIGGTVFTAGNCLLSDSAYSETKESFDEPFGPKSILTKITTESLYGSLRFRNYLNNDPFKKPFTFPLSLCVALSSDYSRANYIIALNIERTLKAFAAKLLTFHTYSLAGAEVDIVVEQIKQLFRSLLLYAFGFDKEEVIDDAVANLMEEFENDELVRNYIRVPPNVLVTGDEGNSTPPNDSENLNDGQEIEEITIPKRSSQRSILSRRPSGGLPSKQVKFLDIKPLSSSSHEDPDFEAYRILNAGISEDKLRADFERLKTRPSCSSISFHDDLGF